MKTIGERELLSFVSGLIKPRKVTVPEIRRDAGFFVRDYPDLAQRVAALSFTTLSSSCSFAVRVEIIGTKRRNHRSSQAFSDLRRPQCLRPRCLSFRRDTENWPTRRSNSLKFTSERSSSDVSEWEAIPDFAVGDPSALRGMCYAPSRCYSLPANRSFFRHPFST